MLISLNSDCFTYNPQFSPICWDEESLFYFHTNHFSSSSWITDALGDVNQHLQQLPYGEDFIDQRQGTFDARYQFTGKERDQMTGFQYFGARYYNSDIIIWLSVDPMFHKHPDYTSYAYVYNNPINFIDPFGLDSVPAANGNMWCLPEGYSTSDDGQSLHYLGNKVKEWDPDAQNGQSVIGGFVDYVDENRGKL